MAMTEKVVFIDFDCTIIDVNSDVQIKLLAGNKGIPDHIKNSNGWTNYMRNIFYHLHEKNVSKEDYMTCLSKMPLVDGMKELLKTLKKQNCEIFILSDSNSFFIEFILQYHNLCDNISKIFTNPAKFSKDGCLQIENFHENKDCSRCPVNLCKGCVLEDYLAHIEDQKHIFYIGDGFYDLCPATKLRENDVVFPRERYQLIKAIEKSPELIKCCVKPWINGYDILKNI